MKSQVAHQQIQRSLLVHAEGMGNDMEEGYGDHRARRETREVRRVVLPPCFEPANGEKTQGGDQGSEQDGKFKM